jgi:hypothetical protein
MWDCVELEAQELQVPTAPPRCQKCRGYARLAAMVLDFRRTLTLHLYQCECGELIWEEKPHM